MRDVILLCAFQTSQRPASFTHLSSSTMSLAKLTSLSTQTLSLLLERQRIQSLPTTPGASTSSLHLRQIIKNLKQLRTGILELSQTDGSSFEAVDLLSGQFDRMRAMLGPDAEVNGIRVYVSNPVLIHQPVECVQLGTSDARTTNCFFASKDTVSSCARRHIHTLHG
jgi:hypothetical protein